VSEAASSCSAGPLFCSPWPPGAYGIDPKARLSRAFSRIRLKKWRFPAPFVTLAVCRRRIFSPAFSRVKRTSKGAGLYKVGDKVVYPHHGAGTVVKKEKREVLGEKREYLTIKILHNDMTVNVPAENAEKVGLRKVIGEDMVKVVVKALTGGGTQMPKNWNRRFKHNRDKMKTGDILELAEVVRNLSLRDREKGLSTGEKQMFVKAKKILASELMYAKDMDEEEAAAWLDDVLADVGTNGKKRATTKTKATAAV
jgi:CarD family transcriptional regulator